MHRLTREVRFAIGQAPGDGAGVAPTNSYAGFPSINGLAHHFALSATIAGALDPASSYLVNIKDVDRAARRVAIPLIEAEARDRPAGFGARTLTRLFEALRHTWPPHRLERLDLSLSPFLTLTCLAREFPMTRLSQKFEFAAAHRLHSPALSDEENRRVYGKCNNPQGHGHNYEVQVTLAGEPSTGTGLLVDVPAFERVVTDVVIDRFDHKHLNLQVPEFADVIPSVENIARVIYGLLKPHFGAGPARLAAVTVWETPKTWCEYSE